MFWLLLSNACTASRVSLNLPSSPAGCGVGKILERDVARTDDPKWPKHDHGTWHLTATHAEILLPTEWLDIICWWEVVNKSFVFLCSCFINCLYPDSSSHLPVLLRRGEIEQLGEQLVSSQGQSTTCAKNHSMENMSCITQEIWPWILLLSVVTVTKKKNVRFFCLIFGLGRFFACESP